MIMIKRASSAICGALVGISMIHAETSLEELIQGTSTTPELSGLQISLMENGTLSEEFALGFAQVEGEAPILLDIEHKIRVASISKLAVSIGILRLVEAGNLSLDEDIGVFLKRRFRNPKFPQTPITIRMLLTHTSSVRDDKRYFIKAAKGSLIDFFEPESNYWDSGAHWASDPAQKPGDYFNYANLNFGLLATLIELSSGERFDQYMENHVLRPLGTSARFGPCDIPAGELATTYRKRDEDGEWRPTGDWVPQVDKSPLSCFYGIQDLAEPKKFLEKYELGSNASLFSPQGGLRASASDLIRMLSMLVNRGEIDGEQFLSYELVKEMFASHWSLNRTGDNGRSSGESEPNGHRDSLMTDYGLSIHRISMRDWGFDEGPPFLLGHLGNAYGVLSFALLEPRSGKGIAAIITGLADDPAKFPGHSPLYRVQEKILNWWINR